MPVSLRPARADDAAALRALHERALLSAGTDPDALPDTSDLDAPASAYPDGAFVVATAGDEAVAMGAVRVADGSAELKRMRVAPARQGEGLGTVVLRVLEGVARARGATRVAAETAASQAGSMAFYPSRGYREVDRRTWDGFELVTFARDL